METYYFVEELPLALEYGMTPEQFWDEDKDLFYAYQKAYINRLHTQAHIQGLYNNIAFGVAIKNAFKKRTEKAAKYPSEAIGNPYLKNKNLQSDNHDENNILNMNEDENRNLLYSVKERYLERQKANK